MFQDELNSGTIYDANFRDHIEGKILEHVRRIFGIIGTLRIDLAIKGNFDGLRIEGRSIVKGDPFPKMKGPYRSILGHFPGLSQCRLYLNAPLLESQQRIVEVTKYTCRNIPGCLGGIQ